MIDPRIYRAAFLPALIALVVTMFSLEPIPDPLRAPVATPIFDGVEPGRIARNIVATAPERTPGSAGSAAIAALIRERFEAIDGGTVSTQDFDGSFDDESVQLENVILTLPGESERVLLIVAPRAADEGPGAGTSAAATAILATLADELGASRHELTFVLASVEGGSDGADGARELVGSLPAPEGYAAALTLYQPGFGDPDPPFSVFSRIDSESPDAQLVETAAVASAAQFGQADRPPGPLGGLAQLAVPFGTGAQSALADEGIRSLSIGTAGERAVDAASDTPERLNVSSLARSGGVILAMVLALDQAPDSGEPGPDNFIRLGENLLPGWSLAALALCLLLPALLTAGDTWLRELRREQRTRRGLPWAAERAIPPLGGLLLAYLLGIGGLIPDPAIPYDPGAFPAGTRALLAFIAIVTVIALLCLLVRPLRTPLDSDPVALASVAGLICGLAILGVWLFNPYLALLLTPAAHLWLLSARAAGAVRRPLIAAFALATLLPALGALAIVASRLDFGAETPWQVLLATVGGQVPLPVAVAVAVLIGGLLACVAAPGARIAGLPGSVMPPVHGPGGHAGPGALGGTPSALPGDRRPG